MYQAVSNIRLSIFEIAFNLIKWSKYKKSTPGDLPENREKLKTSTNKTKKNTEGNNTYSSTFVCCKLIWKNAIVKQAQ
jgi:hypothetical protein